ncbi:hypothetical protein LX32DRAFT_690828 [Colletotrichum zoysiae]|uniref:Uncharacterized protein n=1 Tax=Colletotrichum zoysiae TaxID=1216348 RepID=A0AAD9HQS0_9PEZI|nr:hypothetical protein LX32DRAFT_690828 [Colletotrichum zoysiae]
MARAMDSKKRTSPAVMSAVLSRIERTQSQSQDYANATRHLGRDRRDAHAHLVRLMCSNHYEIKPGSWNCGDKPQNGLLQELEKKHQAEQTHDPSTPTSESGASASQNGQKPPTKAKTLLEIYREAKSENSDAGQGDDVDDGQ